MKKSELRAEARVAVNQRGRLSSGGDWFPCMVLDMSDHGLLLVSSRDVVRGQVLDLRCDLYPGKTLECKIEVRHVSDTGVGARIAEIDEKGSALCRMLMQEQYSDKLNKSG
jgi:hypothetical protein